MNNQKLSILALASLGLYGCQNERDEKATTASVLIPSLSPSEALNLDGEGESTVLQLGLSAFGTANNKAGGLSVPLSEKLFNGPIPSGEAISFDAPKGAIQLYAKTLVAAHSGTIKEACADKEPVLYSAEVSAEADSSKTGSATLSFEEFTKVSEVPVGIVFETADGAAIDDNSFAFFDSDIELPMKNPCQDQSDKSGKLNDGASGSESNKLFAMIPTQKDGGLAFKLRVSQGSGYVDLEFSRSALETSESGNGFRVSVKPTNEDGALDWSVQDYNTTTEDFDSDGVLDSAENPVGSFVLKKFERGSFAAPKVTVELKDDVYFCSVSEENLDIRFFEPLFEFKVGDVVVKPVEGEGSVSGKGKRSASRPLSDVVAAQIDPSNSSADTSKLTCTVKLKDAFDDADTSALTLQSGSIPLDGQTTTAPFDLTWDGAPTLSNACVIQQPGRFFPDADATFASATGSFDNSTAGVLATESGIEVALDAVSLAAKTSELSWSVTSAGPTASSSLERELTLAQVAAGTSLAQSRGLEGESLAVSGCGVNCTSGHVQKIAVAEHVCATEADGTLSGGSLLCWGRNDSQQLGAVSAPETVPDAVNLASLSASFETLLSVSVGADHTCALVIETGSAAAVPLCFGSDAFGQLANGTFAPASENSALGVTSQKAKNPSSSAVLLSGGAVAAALGNGFSCFLTDGGEMACSGLADKGQLGLGDTVNKQIATPIPAASFGVGSVVTSIGAGGNHMCAVVKPADSVLNSELWCWGDNSSNQAGVPGATAFVSSPNKVADLGLDGPSKEEIVQVVGGAEHTCVLTTNSRMKCFGSQSDGKLGNGVTTGQTAVPQEVDFKALAKPIASIAAGEEFNCVLFTDRSVACFGDNSRGQLGTGDNISASFPAVISNHENAVVALSAGVETTCIIKERDNAPLGKKGLVSCFGSDGDGQLGNGSEVGNKNTPVEISDVLLEQNLQSSCQVWQVTATD